MSRSLLLALGIWILALAGCAPIAEVNRVRKLVDDLAVPFPTDQLPSQLLERLASHKVLFFGECHFSREHQDLLLRLASALHQTGCRQVLLESNHADGWMIDDYVLGQRRTLPDATRVTYDPIIEGLRQINAALPAAQRIHLSNIDIDHWPQSFRESLAAVETEIGRQELFRTFDTLRFGMSGYPGALAGARTRLARESQTYRALWGQRWFDRISELLEIEQASIPLRGSQFPGWDNQRDQIITLLVGRRIAECSGQTILNMGANHAQKKPDANGWSTVACRLTQKATADRPAPYVVDFVPMAGQTRAHFYDTSNINFDLNRTAAADDLVVALGRIAGQRLSFLPFEDPAFSQEQFPISFNWGETITAVPAQVFDAVLVYPRTSVIESLDKYRTPPNSQSQPS